MRPGRKVVRVKFGSAHVPIYQGSVRGDPRFTVSFYQNGRRVRRTFDSLAKATEEARTAAMKIQQGLTEVAGMRVADRQNYHAAIGILDAAIAVVKQAGRRGLAVVRGRRLRFCLGRRPDSRMSQAMRFLPQR